MGKINSSEYWDERFATNWDERRGMQQSQLFANMLAKMLPAWAKTAMSEQRLTVCDWGCAEGDGTAKLQKHFPNNKFVGVDFSKVAIDTAKKRYSKTNIKFLTANLLEGKHEGKYDVIVSSNVFEHFHDPWAVFDTISKYAKKHVIILTPYQEDLSYEKEHFHTFALADYKIVRGDFFLGHLDTLNTQEMGLGDNLAWSGTQIMAIYTHREELEHCSLSAQDITLATYGHTFNESTTIHKEEIAKTNAKYEELLSRAHEENKELSQAKEEVEDELKLILTSKRWRAATKIANAVHTIRRKK